MSRIDKLSHKENKLPKRIIKHGINRSAIVGLNEYVENYNAVELKNDSMSIKGYGEIEYKKWLINLKENKIPNIRRKSNCEPLTLPNTENYETLVKFVNDVKIDFIDNYIANKLPVQKLDTRNINGKLVKKNNTLPLNNLDPISDAKIHFNNYFDNKNQKIKKSVYKLKTNHCSLKDKLGLKRDENISLYPELGIKNGKIKFAVRDIFYFE